MDVDLYRLQGNLFMGIEPDDPPPCTVERLGERTSWIVLIRDSTARSGGCSAGHEIRFLKRVRVLNIELGSLKPGQQRRIEGVELEELYRAAYGKTAAT